jgi:hypothetical protein
MANALGRISGQLLKDNLTRSGNDLKFDEFGSTDPLLYLDVNSRRLSINTSVRTRELLVNGTTITDNLISTNGLINLASLELGIIGDQIISSNGVNIVASSQVNANIIETDNLQIDVNTIYSLITDSPIELRPSGTGQININSNTNITGDLYTPYNITLDGNIIFGDSSSDNVEFAADIGSNIIPDQNEFYSIGSNPAIPGNKRWDIVYPNLVNGVEITTGSIASSGLNLGLRQGKIWYVATNGDDSNVGDHQAGPFATIVEALIQSGPGDTVYIYPGTYTEITPLIVPTGVTVKGAGIRSVTVVPDASTATENVFLLNGETTVSDLSVKDFYAPGYAFSFAPGFTVSTRSPYVQNITVITKGSVTSSTDPRGFDEGDAGGGAYVDGSLATSASKEASMLFHSVTFITPGVDALVMTNGVRVEWLNSFSYFANRGLYATNGTLGLASLGVRFGAEIRSIGSANVYGNYGAEADGASTLMYLIQHNFAYIGAGKDVTNDPSLNIQANETVELAAGKIYYQSLDNKGNFKVGDAFGVSFDTGLVSINGVSVSAGGVTSINFANGTDETVIDATQVTTGNVKFSNNLLTTLSGAINLSSGTNEINLNTDTSVSDNLDIDGNFNVDGTLTIGNAFIDIVRFTAPVEYALRPKTDDDYTLGGPTNKRWDFVYLDTSYIGNYKLENATISTVAGSADAELRADGTGKIYINQDNAEFDQDLTVNGTTNLGDNALTSAASVTGTIDHTGLLDRTGDTEQTGTYDQDGYLDVSSDVQIANVTFIDNTISTVTADTNLEFGAASTGKVTVPSADVQIDNNLFVTGNIQADSVGITTDLTTDSYSNGNIEISLDLITTTVTDSDLEFRAAGTGKIYASQDSVKFDQDLTVDGIASLRNTVIGIGTFTTLNVQNVAGSNGAIGLFFLNGWPSHPAEGLQYVRPGWTVVGQPTWVVSAVGDGVSDETITITGGVFVSGQAYAFTGTIPAELTLIGDYLQTGDMLQTGNREITNTLDVTNNVYFDNINIVDNRIFTTNSNDNLELRAVGTGTVVFDDNTQFSQAALFGTLESNGLTNSGTITSDIFTDGDIEIYDNYITTTVGNNDLELTANGSGKISLPLDPLAITEDLTVDDDAILKSVTINGDLDHLGNTTQTGNVTQTGDFDLSNDLTVTGTDAFFTDVRIINNRIATSISNNNLELGANGTGIIKIADGASFGQTLTVNGITSTTTLSTVTGTITSDIFTNSDIEINDNYITTTVGNNNLILTASGTGGAKLEKLKFNSTTLSTESNNDNIILSVPAGSLLIDAATALKIPVGTTVNRPALTQGELRFNTTENLFRGYSTATVTFAGVYSADRLTKVLAHPTNNTIGFTTNNSLAVTVSSTGFAVNALAVDNLLFDNNTVASTLTNADITLDANGSGYVKIGDIAIESNEFLNLHPTSPLILQNTSSGYVKFAGTTGIAIPAGDIATRPLNPETGDMRWNTELSEAEVFNGVNYQALSGSGGDVLSAEEVQEETNLWALVLG